MIVDYLISFLTVMTEGTPDEAYSFVTEQMSAKKGLKIFGDPGAEAIVKELEQLVYQNVMRGQDANALSPAQRRDALRYLMFLKEKRSGNIKGRGCADGRKQRLYKSKDETSSPTVTTESIFLTCMIDAAEDRDVATCDIPGAFMQVNINDHIQKLENE